MSTKIDQRMIDSVGWRPQSGFIGLNLEVTFLLPFNREGVALVPPDLKDASYENLGWTYWELMDAAIPREWAGMWQRHAFGKRFFHLMRLQLAHVESKIGGDTFTKKALVTSGNPATWLVDGEGRLVPELCWNQGKKCLVRVLFFQPRSLINYGWFSQYPEIGLQFLYGVCPLSDKQISQWLTEKGLATG